MKVEGKGEFFVYLIKYIFLLNCKFFCNFNSIKCVGIYEWQGESVDYKKCIYWEGCGL